jgi:hypothetical protein
MPDVQRQILEELQRINGQLAVIAKRLKDVYDAMPSEPSLTEVETLLEKIAENTATDD